MTKTNVQVGALALKVFTDAIHHDEALKPEWRVPERLHADMVEALADLRALLERAEAAEQERDALKVQLDDAIEVSRSHADAADDAEERSRQASTAAEALAGALEPLVSRDAEMLGSARHEIHAARAALAAYGPRTVDPFRPRGGAK